MKKEATPRWAERFGKKIEKFTEQVELLAEVAPIVRKTIIQKRQESKKLREIKGYLAQHYLVRAQQIL